jgi:Secretion system C-terminal sorting domain
MKKIYFSLITVLFIVTGSFAQTVTVTGADAATNAGSPYTTLRAAFVSINAASQAGNNILITISGTTIETSSAFLLQSSGPWTSLTINPVGVASVTGNFSGPLVNLAGADNVTINGLNTGGNALSIDNPNTGNAAALWFSNDATNNTIIDCNLLGSTASAASAVVFFTGGATTTGNDNNTITECNISASSGGTPINGILSIGTSAVLDNSNNTISVNNISDFFSPTSGSTGIQVNTFSSGWTITNNALYQTATRTVTGTSTYNAIWVTAGSGYTISNNVIGFAAPNATGTTNMIGLSAGALGGTFPSSFTPGGTPTTLRYNAISCSFDVGGAVSSIQNNTIGGIAIYTSSGANTANGILCGIQVTSGNANIGTVTGNTIGSATGTSSLYAASTTAGAVISGIYCTTTNTINIQNNIIGGIDVSGTAATLATGFKGIDAAGTGTYTISANSVGNAVANNIRTGYLLTGANLSNTATTPTTASGGGAIQGIVHSSTGTTVNITNNTIRGFQISGSASPFTGIINSGVISTALNITNNNLGTSATGVYAFTSSNSSPVSCITNNTNSATLALSISNNNFQGTAYSAASIGAFQCINNTATVLSASFNNNNFNNLTINTSHSTIGFFIASSTATPTVTISNNYVTTQFTNSTSTGGGNYVAIANNGGTPATGSTTISNNTLSNITYKTVASFGAMIYWNSGSGAACSHNTTVTGNTIYNVANTGAGAPPAQAANNYGILVGLGSANLIANNIVSTLTATGGTVIGIFGGTVSTNAAGSLTVRNNTLSNFTSTSSFNVTSTGGAQGIQIQSGPAANHVYKNKIYNINANQGTVTGIVIVQATAGSVNNVYNNHIGQLYATNSVFFQAVRGINSGSTVANTLNAYYNTVYLDGNCPGNSYAFYMGSVNPTVNLNNNILVNNATPTGSLEQLAIFRIGTLTATYSTTSNNNILYAGTPGPLHLIYGDGAAGTITNPQLTLAAFQVFAGPTRENLSMTEIPPFLSTTGSSSAFLHINPAIATQVESGAVNIPTYTDDYDGDIRQGNPGYPGTSTGTAPDIGADEADLTVDNIAPDITYTALTSAVCNTNRTFTATISDYFSGVNTTAGTRPRVYYKKSTNSNSLGGTNTSATDGWKWVEGTFVSGTTYSFTINYSLLFSTGTVSTGDNIQYFVTAQDIATTPNIAINSGTFAATPASVALTAAAFPLGGVINSYNIVATISTSITIGAAGTYTSLTGTNGLFADLNTKGLSGNTTVNIIDASVTETGANSLNQVSYDCAGPYTLTIKPNAAGTTLTGSLASAALIKIKSSNVIIDGSSNGSSSRDLTITNTSVTAPQVLLIGSTGSVAVTNTTVKNCIIINGVNTSSALVVSDGTSAGSSGYFNNITLQNNSIQRAYMGVFCNAVATAGNGSGLNILNNTINTSGGNAIRYTGIYVQGVDGVTISGNDIGNFETTTGEVDLGIWLATGTGNAIIEKNNIHDIHYTGTGGYGGKGITISSGLAAANITVRNNMIFGITGDGDSYSSFGATYCPVGIYAFGTGQGGINIYYNSIHLFGSTLNFAADVYSFGIALDNNTTATIKDNIVKNELGLLGAIGVGAVGIVAQTAASQFTSLDYNDYYSLAALGTNLIGKIGATNYATLAAWQTATAQEANSLNANPFFTSATDLHLAAALNCDLDGYGTPIAGITTDYDNNTRDVAAPDMGADEFTAVYTSLLAGTVGSAVCTNKTVSPLGTTYGTGSCQLIAYVLPSGGSAVNGKVNVCVTRDATPLTFNGEPYVQRHYDIEPVTTPSTATATITLYFTDAEFINYNTTYPAWPTLPTNGAGNTVANRNNVRITQFHGVGFGSPTAPGNYPGTRVLITPGDANVVWNGSFWEVTIPVTGFSGFYLHTTLTNAPLPIIVNYLTGRRQGSNHLLNWKVTCTTSPRATMTLERSSDSRNYSGLYTITADAVRCQQPFDYTDANPLKGMNYYRLKIVDADGKITYSTTVALLNAVKGFDIISIAPNPVVTDKFNLNVTSAQAGKMEISIFDMQGRLVNRQTLSLIAGYNSMPVNVANLAPGTYTIKGSMGDDQSKVIRFVKQ